MKIIINSKKTFLYFADAIDKEFDNLSKDKKVLEKIKDILKNISNNSLLPDLDQETVEISNDLLNRLNNIQTTTVNKFKMK